MAGSEADAAARIQAVQRGRLARLSIDRRRRSLVRRESTARWEREQAVIKIQVKKYCEAHEEYMHPSNWQWRAVPAYS